MCIYFSLTCFFKHLRHSKSMLIEKLLRVACFHIQLERNEPCQLKGKQTLDSCAVPSVLR